jgi:hypothetical protein
LEEELRGKNRKWTFYNLLNTKENLSLKEKRKRKEKVRNNVISGHYLIFGGWGPGGIICFYLTPQPRE